MADQEVSIRLRAVAELGDVDRTGKAIKELGKNLEAAGKSAEIMAVKLTKAEQKAADLAAWRAKYQNYEPKISGDTSKSTSVSQRTVDVTSSGLTTHKSEAEKLAQKKAEEKAAGEATELQMREEKEQRETALRGQREAQAEERKRTERARQADAAARRTQREQDKMAAKAEREAKAEEQKRELRERQATENKLSQVREQQGRIAAEQQRRANARNNLVADANRQREKTAATIAAMDAAPVISTAAAFTALTTAAAGAAVAVQAFANEEEKVAALNESLRKRGALTNENKKALEEYALALQAATNISDEDWKKAMSGLLDSGADVSNLTALTEAVKNLAGSLDGDIGRASLAFQKALKGNFENLREVGIVVPQAATQAEKMAAAFEMAAERGAGKLEATTDTLIGRQKGLRVALTEVKEAVGGLISRMVPLNGLAEFTANGMLALARMIKQPVEPLNALKNASKDTEKELAELAESLNTTESAAERVKNASKKAAEAIDMQREAVQKLKSAQDEIDDAQMAVALANVDRRELNGMGKEEAIIARKKIRDHFAGERFKRDQTTDAEIVALNRKRLAEMDAAMELEASNVGGARSQFEKSAAAQRAEGKLGDLQMEIAKAETRLQQSYATGQRDFGGGGAGEGSRDNSEALAIQAEIDRLKAEVEQQRAAATAAREAAGGVGSGEAARALQEAMKAKLTRDELDREERRKLQTDIGARQLGIDTRSSVFKNRQEEARIRAANELTETRRETLPDVRQTARVSNFRQDLQKKGMLEDELKAAFANNQGLSMELLQTMMKNLNMTGGQLQELMAAARKLEQEQHRQAIQMRTRR